MKLSSSLARGGSLFLLAGCSFGSDGAPEPAAKEPSSQNAVLYTIGASTDPYGTDSAPGGFGVVTSLGERTEAKVEIREPSLGSFGGAEWIAPGRILVPRGAPPIRRPLIYGFQSGRLEQEGVSPLPRAHVNQTWSPDGASIASEPIARCKQKQRTLYECYRQAGAVFVQRVDGSGRRWVSDGHVDSWTPDGHLLVTASRSNAFEALDTQSGQRSLPLGPEDVAARAGVEKASIGPPRWSGDGRYLAALAGVKGPGALIVARADGSVIRLITSSYIISMFAWSPVGHRLAYTTSGFPDPHELFVLHEPTVKPVRLFVTGERHFDWITWAPDGKRLLLDETAGTWRLLPVQGRARERTFPRLGGRPLWCCPVNAYATNG
jgi:hypothetical protein